MNQRVSFDAGTHTYTLDDGTVLSGITSIIHEYLFPDQYAGVSESVLEAARERGSAVHGELESLFNGIPDELLVRPETHAYIRLRDENKIKQIAAEYLVSDNEVVATCIDSVLKTKGGYGLIDYKTTSVLFTEYLQWQLSIEAYLFEKQTGKKVTELYAVWMPKAKDYTEYEAKLVAIDRLPDEYVEDLLLAYRDGAGDEYINPMHKISDDMCELINQYKKAEESVIELKSSLEYYQSIQAAIKEKIKEQMDAKAQTKLEAWDVTVTRSNDSVRRTFKADLLTKKEKPENVQAWLDEHLDECYAETKVNGNVTIKFK